MFEEIEREIEELAEREGKEVSYIEGMLETAAVPLETIEIKPNGLDEIAELDESGGGE